jgi:UV DNA damage repair endonuclease
MDKLREKFLKSYSNLPEKVREEIVVVIDGKPYSWDSSYLEVKENTELGKKILNNLKILEII